MAIDHVDRIERAEAHIKAALSDIVEAAEAALNELAELKQDVIREVGLAYQQGQHDHLKSEREQSP